MIRTLLLAACAAAAAAHPAPKVGTMRLDAMMRTCDWIGVGRVASVDEVEHERAPVHLRVARLEVERTLLGDPELDEVRFLATPTWACDISRAVEGERVLLFLRSPDRPAVRGIDLPAGVLAIAHSGRGRVPLAIEGEREFLAHAPQAVELPRGLAFRDGKGPWLEPLAKEVRELARAQTPRLELHLEAPRGAFHLSVHRGASSELTLVGEHSKRWLDLDLGEEARAAVMARLVEERLEELPARVGGADGAAPRRTLRLVRIDGTTEVRIGALAADEPIDEPARRALRCWLAARDLFEVEEAFDGRAALRALLQRP